MTELLLLTVDSLRADRFDPQSFPECWGVFDSEFVRFERAVANGVATPLSFPSILTGAPATGDGTLPADRPTIAELYEGYAWAASNNPHLRPGRDYDRGFDFFVDDLEQVGGERETDPGPLSEVVERARSAVGWATDDDDAPDLTPPPNSAEHVVTALRDGMARHRGFFWAHFIDPHYQFKPQKVRDEDIAVDHTNGEILAMNERYVDGHPTPDDIEFLARMYEAQISYLDRQLADLFDHLKRHGRWDDTAIVFAVDHGEAFGEQGVYNHQWDADPIDPLIRVPLLVKFPEGERGGRTYDHLVANADIIATLAETFGWKDASPPHTRPLVSPEPRVVVSKSTTAVRVTTDDGTGIRRLDGSMEVDGSVGDDAMESLRSASIPAVEKLSGVVPGVTDDERRDLEQRLDDLGYR